MEITDAVKTEVFRPLMSVAIPGAIAVAPYVIVAQHYIPSTLTFWHEHDAAFTAIVVACMLAAGLMLEDIGALVEEKVVDRLLGRRHPKHRAEWECYLQLKIRDEYVGQRYLRGLVTRLKFELSMFPAILSLWIGLAWLQCLNSVWQGRGFLCLSLFLLAVASYLLLEAYQSAAALMNTRRLILEAAASQSHSAS